MALRRRLELPGEFPLESGEALYDVTLEYETWGELAPDASNAVLIMHALTGDSHVASHPEVLSHPELSQQAEAPAPVGTSNHAEEPGWWEYLVGPGKAVDTNRFFVVCANVLGGCRGSTGPGSIAPDGHIYGSRFPRLSIRDQVRADISLGKALGIDSWHCVLGGSMGGAKALEFSLLAPEAAHRIGVIAAPAVSQAEQIAWAEAQLAAIRLDPDFRGGDYYGLPRQPEQGLGLARKIAHMTYRSAEELNQRFGNTYQEPRGNMLRAQGEGYTKPVQKDTEAYAINSYLDYQAKKLVNRFDAGSYVVLTEALRDHDICRGRHQQISATLRGAGGKFLVIGISSDRLYPPSHVREIATALGDRAQYREIPSTQGHDGFLVPNPHIVEAVGSFLD